MIIKEKIGEGIINPRGLEPNERKLMLINNKIYTYACHKAPENKQWLLDQIMRIIHEDKYDAWVEKYCDGEDGPNTYTWDVGKVP